MIERPRTWQEERARRRAVALGPQPGPRELLDEIFLVTKRYAHGPVTVTFREPDGILVLALDLVDYQALGVAVSTGWGGFEEALRDLRRNVYQITAMIERGPRP